MPEPTSSLPEVLAQFVAASPSPAVQSIADGLSSGRITLASSAVGVGALRDVLEDTAERAVITFAKLADGMDAKTVAFALLTALRLRGVERHDRPEIEIVWTGPEAEGPIMRHTSAVVEEMLRGVREVGHILIVGYSLTVGPNSPMDRIVELLVEASRKRVAITLVLQKDSEAGNKARLLKAWNVFAKKPQIYTWDPPPDHPYAKLHAKALVVDRLDLLVTSANLTFHGMASNLELGLRVKGPQAAAVAQRFEELIAVGVLQRWE
jgi:phosphatidylserine/phosphatidylglycerophosphate/cardiolipin synthase-like enzyme